MSKVAVILVLTSGLTLSVGCGGGSGSGFHTSVAGNKPLNTLSTSETKQLCTDAVTYLTSSTTGFTSKDSICRASGLELALLSSNASSTDQQLQAACQAGYALCESSDAGVTRTGLDGGAPTDQCSTTSLPSTCTATVNQYTACVDELTAALANLFPPCNTITQAKLTALTADGGDPSSGLANGPACAAFSAACPDMAVGPTMMSSPLTFKSR